MDRNRAIEAMTNFVMDINRQQIAMQPNIQPEHIEPMLEQARVQVYQINAGLYDLLKNAGVING